MNNFIEWSGNITLGHEKLQVQGCTIKTIFKKFFHNPFYVRKQDA